MSGNNTEQGRSKRRRCAPKRYAEEDESSSGLEDTLKSSPESDTKQRQQNRVQPRAAAHTTGLLWQQSGPTRLQPVESDNAQALHNIQQLAARLQQHGRPHLQQLFHKSEKPMPGPAVDRYAMPSAAMVVYLQCMMQLCMCRNPPQNKPLLTKDVAEAAALLVSFGS